MTKGIRTWRRTSRDTTLPIDERIQESTNPAHMEEALRSADFITLPRYVINFRTGEVLHDGYDDAYAMQVEQALRQQFGFHGGIRTSQSGRSHVIERESASGGGAFDLGITTATGDGSPVNVRVAA